MCVCPDERDYPPVFTPQIEPSPPSAALKLLIDATLLTASIAFKKNIHYPVIFSSTTEVIGCTNFFNKTTRI